MKKLKVAVLGAGSWGTALAELLARQGIEVALWARDPSVVSKINSIGRNPKYLSEIELAPSVRGTESISDAINGAQVIVLAVPSSGYRELLRGINALVPLECILVSTAKGLEVGSTKRMSEVIGEELPKTPCVVLSGPSFAKEVALGLPTAVTFVASNLQTAKDAAEIFHSEQFRVYTSTDLIGVELGGVMKNVIALASGIVDGKALGTNARAALITRGVAEMQRLVVAAGGEAQTVSGLSGLGDLLLTATGDLSRNRQVGMRLGRGEKLPEILESLGQVAEGVRAAPVICQIAERYQLSLPISEVVSGVIGGELTVEQAITALLSRSQKREFHQKVDI